MDTDATVFVVGDKPEVVASLRQLLEADGLRVEAYLSVRTFLDAFDPHRPGCLVLDLQMPQTDGLELQRRLLSYPRQPVIVFLTGRGDVKTCAEAMKAGAIDFCEKPSTRQHILDLVHRALDKDRRSRSVEAVGPEIAARIDGLTPRERTVMRLLAEGKSIKTIAGELGIGFQTAAKHRSRTLKKLRVENEVELVRLLANHPHFRVAPEGDCLSVAPPGPQHPSE